MNAFKLGGRVLKYIIRRRMVPPSNLNYDESNVRVLLFYVPI
jgi:hypothetical protein